MDYAISIIVSYLVGSISFSYIFTKKIKKVDIRQLGSGNAGATNTLRVLGKGPAITVLLLDILKGVFAVLLGEYLAGPGLVPALAGLAAILGHNWPIYYGFRGGKGVATTIGVLATLMFVPTVVGGIMAILTIVVSRYVSLGSLVFMLATTASSAFLFIPFNYPVEYFYFSWIVTALSIWRHRANINRLIRGTESKIGSKDN